MRPTLLSVATVNMFTFASSALFILYATTTLGVSPGALGLALGVGSVGAVIGAIFASRIGRRIGLGPAYALGLLIFPTSLLLIPLADADMSMALILALLLGSEFGAGFGVMILDINIGAIIYARTPDRIRARAAGAFRFINYGVRPIGALLGGLLGTRDRRARGDLGRRRSRRSVASCSSSDRRSCGCGTCRRSRRTQSCDPVAGLV